MVMTLARGVAVLSLLAPILLIAAEQNTDRPGLDYYSFNLSHPNPALCRQTCDADDRCKAWTYVKPGIQGPTARCWLKHAVPRAYTNNCCVSGVKQGTRSESPAASAPRTADCSALREHYDKRCGEMRSYYSRLNCERHGYSGCALDVAGCFTPYLPGHVFTDEACGKPGYKTCASHAYNNYIECLAGCNKSAIEGRLPGGRAPCAKSCQQDITGAVASCR